MTRRASWHPPLAFLWGVVVACPAIHALPTGDDDFPGRRVDTPGAAARVVVVGPLAYVADKSAGLLIVDLADPFLRVVGSVVTPDANGVTIDAGIAYVADGDLGLVIVDVRRPENPVILSAPNHCLSYDVAISGRHAHLAVYGGLQVFDVGDPARPAYVGDVDWMATTRAVVTDGPLAYYACSRRGIRIFDITNPTRPALVREVDTPGEPMDLALAGERLYVADGSAGLVVVDVSDPLRAAISVSAPTRGPAVGVDVSGRRAYVSVADVGLEVFDVSVPGPPHSMTTYTSVLEGGGVGVFGDDVVAANGTTGLVILDGRAEANLAPRCDPGGPYQGFVGQRIRFGTGNSIDPDGTLARFEWAYGDGGFDMGPEASHVYTQPGVYTVRLCVADDEGVVSCCETSVDLVPTAVGIEFAATERAGAVHLEWTISPAALALECRVHRRAAGEALFLPLGTVPVTSAGPDRQHFEFVDAAVEPGRTYVYRIEVVESDGTRSFAEREVALASATVARSLVLHPASPNPFNPSTRIAFDLPHPGPVCLTIHDAAGRRVRRLLDTPLAGTRHTAVWDGRDDAGRPLASGVYVVRLDAAGALRSRKIVLAQ